MTRPGFDELNGALQALSEAAGEQSDVLTLTESRLLESRLKTLMIPSSRPIDVAVGSGFGFRADPFTGRGALHTGLDFPSPVGTEIHAAAGGVVRTAEMHPEYGLMLEIDHGNGLMTRYGHTSKILVKVGDLVKRGQVVADVGTTDAPPDRTCISRCWWTASRRIHSDSWPARTPGRPCRRPRARPLRWGSNTADPPGLPPPGR